MGKYWKCWLLLFVCAGSALGAIPTSERAVLIAAYDSTHGDNWTKKTGWKTPPLHTDGFAKPGTEGNWNGITVTSDHVTAIVLVNNNLTGRINAKISDLPNLQKINLSHNHLTGCKVTGGSNYNYVLTELRLADNHLGTDSLTLYSFFPVNLAVLDLSGNKIGGSLPSWIAFGYSFSKLKTLRLDNNQFSGGITSQLQYYTSLDTLRLDYNMLSTSSSGLRTFLNSKNPTWESTQTVTPTNAAATPVSDHTIRISWTPIPYTQHNGYYEVGYSTTYQYPNYSQTVRTSDKSASYVDVDGLAENTSYYFSVRTVTLPHDSQQDTLVSEYAVVLVAKTKSSHYLAIVSGDMQTGMAATMLPAPLVVKVTDYAGNPISNYPVHFRCDSYQGGWFNSTNLDTADVLTDANGTAMIFWFLPPETGIKQVEAYCDFNKNNPVRFTANVQANPVMLPEIEREALRRALWNALGGEEWKNSSGWQEPPLDNDGLSMPGTEADWYGLTLSGGHVVEINLKNNNLSGYLHDDQLPSLSYLQTLLLDSNGIYYEIPESLCRLNLLTELNLSHNSLSYSLPDSLGFLSNLVSCRLNHNAFKGEIPASITKLTSVGTNLSLDYNGLSSSDSTVRRFLDLHAPGWELTQTTTPKNLRATTLSFTEIKLEWDPILYQSDGGFYNISYRDFPANHVYSVDTDDKSVSSIIINTLSAGKTYYFKIRAYTPAHDSQKNSIYSDFSAEIMATTSISKPGCETLSATDITALAATLQGTVNPNGGTTTVKFQYGLTNSYGDSAVAQQSPISGNTAIYMSASISGLKPGTVYHYRIAAANSAGTAYGEDLTFTTLAMAPTVTLLPVTDITTTTATLSGTVNANGASAIVSFEYGPTTAYGTTITAIPSPVSGNEPDTVSIFLTGLERLRTYHYRLVAANAKGTTTSDDATFKTVELLIPLAERAALTVLYDSTHGDGWHIKTGWKNPPLHTDGFAMPGSEASWYGITISESHVREIDLVANNLAGTLPDATKDLSGLTSLNLSHNGITGAFPSCLGHLINLDSLDFSCNYLSGSIPAGIDSLNNLKLFKVSNNQLSGPLPAEMVHLTQLHSDKTDLGYNALYSDNIALVNFLKSKDTDWQSTQTIKPDLLRANATSDSAIHVHWQPIQYKGDGGYYVFKYGISSGVYSDSVTTSSKTDSTLIVDGLSANTRYYFSARSYTPPHGMQKNALYSDMSGEISETTWFEKPLVITTPASAVTDSSATLRGSVNSHGTAAMVRFLFGLTTAYGDSADAMESPVSDTTAVAVSRDIGGLAPGTKYHFTSVVITDRYRVYGEDQSFTTTAPVLQVATPTFDPSGGTYPAAQTVTLSCSTADARIYYTLDGSTPVLNSSLYSQPITINSSATLKVRAFKTDWEPSAVDSAVYIITGTVATPTFNPPGGIYTSAQSVTISCLTAGATMRYTLDASEPLETSSPYTIPLQISATTTVKAKAFYQGWTPSATATATYTITGTVATPTFNPSGGTYPTTQKVTLSCATAGADIYYTLDGSTPTQSSSFYLDPITINSSATLKARAFKADWAPSAVDSAIYIITGTVATPTFNPPTGIYTYAQSVAISCLTTGVTIRYTLDASEPSESSTVYSTPLQISATTTVKAKAFYEGWTPSATAAADYTITGAVATPTFDPPGGTYPTAQTVTLSCATLGAAIYYTLDGSTPTQSYSLYSQPITISSSATLKARAFKADWLPSAVDSAVYIITGTVATPTFQPPAGTYTTAQSVTISCLTAGATIRYTMDASEPSETSEIYTAPLQVATTTTVKAKAFYEGWTPSATAAAAYTITGAVATPTFDPPGGTYPTAQTVTLSCATAGAAIYYTLDGATPTQSSIFYAQPIEINSSATLKAKAFKADWAPSAVDSAVYIITGTVATPTFNPPGGIYTSAQSVTITCLTAGATIRFTLDASEPSESSTAYATLLQISATTTVKAKAFYEGWTPSATATAVYTISPGGDGIAPQIAHTASTTANAGSDVTISAVINDNVAVQTAQLFYRRGGSTTFDMLPMVASGENYSAAIPAAAVTDRGLEYYILASDGQGNRVAKPENFASPYIIQVRSSNLISTVTTPAMAYRMISVPGILDYPAVLNVLEDDLGGYDDTQWRLLRYANNGLLEYGQSGFPAFTPGNGFWLITAASKSIDAGSAKSMSTAKNFVITLAPGWNQIGNPFTFAVDWSQVILNGEVETKLVGYYGAKNESGGYDPFRSELIPWEGYFLHNLGTTETTIEIPARANSAALSKSTLDHITQSLGQNEWYVQISAHSGVFSDLHNYFGALKNASPEWDANDFSEPPTCGGFISLSFPHLDWSRYPDYYSGDFRPLNRDHDHWDFQVSCSDDNQIITLRLENIHHLPQGQRLCLNDLSTGRSLNLAAGESYQYLSSATERRFSIALVEESEDQVQEAPGSYVLWFNYPNPFNLSTRITFEIPERTQVALTVYDLQGKRIKSLTKQVYPKGLHQVSWDGCDEESLPAATGLYLVHMQAGSFIETIRVILMK